MGSSTKISTRKLDVILHKKIPKIIVALEKTELLIKKLRQDLVETVETNEKTAHTK